MIKTLFLMVGYPGAGKTTTARIIHELTGATHLWADHERRELYGTPSYSHEENIHLYENLNAKVERLLAAGHSVVYDTNFNYYHDRELMREVAKKHDAQTVLIWVTIDRDLALARATDNAHLQKTRVLGNMPLATFNHITGQLEEPGPEEQTIVLDGTKLSPEYVAKALGL